MFENAVKTIAALPLQEFHTGLMTVQHSTQHSTEREKLKIELIGKNPFSGFHEKKERKKNH